MSTKFFLFHKEEVGQSSVTESDTGAGVSIFAAPASSISHISASKGFVRIAFKDAGVYDFAQVADGDGIKKTTVDVECEEGQESILINDILNFIGSSNQPVMKFDFVSQTNNFRKAKLTDTKSINVQIPVSPQSTNQKSITFVSTGLTSFVLDGIEFTEETYPIVDYNPSSFVTPCPGTGIPKWNNASELGGTAYNAESAVLVYYPKIMTETGKNVSGLGATSVVKATSICDFPPYSATGASAVSIDDYLGPIDLNPVRGWSLNNELTISGEYTSYFVIGVPIGRTPDNFGVMYSGANTSGPFSNAKTNSISVRSDKSEGFVSSPTNLDNDVSVSYSFPDRSTSDSRQTCYVFVVRRDSKNNIIAHNHNGDIISVISAKTDGIKRTDGDLKINSLLTQLANDATINVSVFDATYEFISRIGFIQKDIGASEASRLAKALYNRYKP
jgi:hypothetical protein